MKKILFLILVLFSINCFAGFMSKSQMFDCEKSTTFYLKKKVCIKNHADCVRVPRGYHCSYFSELDTEIDDSEKPIMGHMEDCTTPDICEKVIIGYEQKTVKRIREDAAKKALYDAALADKETARAERLSEIQQIKAAINLIQESDKPAWEKKLLIRLVKELR